METKRAMLSAIVPLLMLQLAGCAMGTALRFTTQATEVQIGDGGTASIHCVATGTVHSGDEFDWSGPAVNSSRTTTTKSSSGTTSNLVITNFQASDTGLYSCSITGRSDVISITLTHAGIVPTFLDVLTTQQVAEGTDAVIVCPFSPMNDLENTFTHWTNVDDTRISGNRFAPSRNGELRIHDVRMEDTEMSFKCGLVRDGGEIIGDKIITIEVLPRSDFAPSINDTNRRIEVVHGEPLDLPCLLEEPKDNVVYSWTINTEFEHDHIIDTLATLHRDPSKFLGGVYTCRTENEFGYDLADFTVKIVAPPLPTDCSLVRKTPELGTTVILKYCDLTSPVDLSDLSFQWRKVNSNGAPVNVQLGGRYSVNHNGWLTIENVQAADLGEYRVTVSNEMGTAVHDVQLELAGVTTQPTPAPLTQSQRQHGSTSVNVKVVFSGGRTSCGDFQTMDSTLIRNHLSQMFSIAGATLGRSTFTCPADESSYGIFNVILRGERAEQVAAAMKGSRIPDLTLNNGQTVTLKVCSNDCSLEGEASPISNTAGVIVAAMFILVVLAGLALLIVILVKYRRRNLSIKIDEEQVLPLNLTTSTQTKYNTQDIFDSDSLPKKPIYGRSISLNLPLTR